MEPSSFLLLEIVARGRECQNLPTGSVYRGVQAVNVLCKSKPLSQAQTPSASVGSQEGIAYRAVRSSAHTGFPPQMDQTARLQSLGDSSGFFQNGVGAPFPALGGDRQPFLVLL